MWVALAIRMLATTEIKEAATRHYAVKVIRFPTRVQSEVASHWRPAPASPIVAHVHLL